MKKTVLAMAVLWVAAVGFSGTGKPNMVIYLADDHGRLDCSVYGPASIKTPTMKKLAAGGMVFNNAFVASPSCGPSRSALLTGLMPARNGAEPNHTKPRPETAIMVKLLQKQGYEVVAFGKVAHGGHAAMYGFDLASGKRSALAGQVQKFLAGRPKDKPLCLIVGDKRPHVAWIKESTYDPSRVELPAYLVDTQETREHWARYLTDVTGMDAEMGEVDRLTREYFGSDDYLFMYTSDHGGQWPFGKWNLYDSGINVPMIVRWPGRVKPGSRTDAMVSWIDLFPTLIDLAGGEIQEGIDGTSFADVMLGKSDCHREVIMTTHTGDGRMNVYPIRSVRTERFKYIRNIRPDCYHSNHSDMLRKDGAGAYWDSWDEAAKTDPEAAALIKTYYERPAIEFYDLEKDPRETVNLAENPEYKAQINKMSAMLDDWMNEQGDQQTIHGKPYPVSGPVPYIVGRSKGHGSTVGRKKTGQKKQ